MFLKFDETKDTVQDREPETSQDLSLDGIKEKLAGLFPCAGIKDVTSISDTLHEKCICLDDGTSINLPYNEGEQGLTDDLFSPFEYIDESASPSHMRSEIEPRRDLFEEFGFDLRESLIGWRHEESLIGSNDFDFYEAFDEYTDESLYSASGMHGPNCLAYAYGMPKEPDGSKFDTRPCPGHFAGIDDLSELSYVMEHGSPQEIKAIFEEYMSLDFDALGKEMREVPPDYQPQKGERMFALATTSGHIPFLGSDFHFYLKGDNGYWSHKPGVTNPTIFDNSDNLIKDPTECDRGIYTNFVGCYVIKDK